MSLSLKKIFDALTIIALCLAVIVPLITFYQYTQEESAKEYNESLIPLVNLDFNEFREFLDENIGETIKFKTSFDFSAATDINYKINELCGYFKFSTHSSNELSESNAFTFNVIRYKNNKSHTTLSCYDSISLKMKDPTRLQFSYGGTGIVTLPFYGTFIIERRAITSSETQYTLLEITAVPQFKNKKGLAIN
jgi:hypothetical protein